MSEKIGKTERTDDWKNILSDIADLNDDSDYKEKSPLLDKCIKDYVNQINENDSEKDIGRVAMPRVPSTNDKTDEVTV